MTFQTLPDSLRRALALAGICEPTRIQLLALAAPQSNMLLLAKAGTGKTLAYLLPVLANQLKYKNFNKTVILVPTRQLAQQVFRVTKRLLQNLGQFKATLAIGGIPLEQDRRNIKKGMDNFVVGTFGRLMEWAEKGLLQQSQVGFVVIDQVDKFFQQGQQKLAKFMSKLQIGKKQCLMATATCSPQLMQYLLKKVPGLQVMACEPQESTKKAEEKINLQGLKVFFFQSRDEFSEKAELLVSVLKTLSYTRCLVFYNSLSEGNKLYARLSQQFQAHFLHSSIGQFARMTLLANITSAPIVVTSDLLARGFDSKDVDLVVQWQFPYLQEDYLHRYGRCGRRGQQSLGLQFGQWKSQKILLQAQEYDLQKASNWLQTKQTKDLRMQQVELQPQEVAIGEWEDFDPQKQADLQYKYYPQELPLEAGPEEITEEEILACEHCRRVMQEAGKRLGYKFVLLEG